LPAVTQSIQRPLASSAISQPVLGDQLLVQASAANSQSQFPSQFPSASFPAQFPSASSTPNKVDLLADFGGDPFAGPVTSNKSTGVFFLISLL
jgi:hypothetical protein